jgi:hypothetical protein
VESFHIHLESIMRAGRDLLVSQALHRLTIDRHPARSVAVTRNRRFYLRLVAWLIGLPVLLFIVLFPAWNRVSSIHRNEIHGGVAGFVKVASADDYDLLDDAQREETSGMLNAPHAAQVYSRIKSDDSDALDDAQREETRGAQTTTRI